MRQVAVLNSGVLQKALSEQLKENTQLSAKDMAEKMATTSPAAELESQANELQFQVAVTAAAGRSAVQTRCTLMLVSSSGRTGTDSIERLVAAVLRFLCEHIESIPLSVFNRMLQTHDVMLLLIPLIENPPWTRRRPDGKWQKLVDFKWQVRRRPIGS